MNRTDFLYTLGALLTGVVFLGRLPLDPLDQPLDELPADFAGWTVEFRSGALPESADHPKTGDVLFRLTLPVPKDTEVPVGAVGQLTWACCESPTKKYRVDLDRSQINLLGVHDCLVLGQTIVFHDFTLGY